MCNGCSIPNCPHCSDWDNALKVGRVSQLPKERGSWLELFGRA